MTVLVERLKIAAQEAERVHRDEHVAVTLTLVPDGVLVTARDHRYDKIRSHASTVTWSEIENGLNNPLVAHIGRAVIALAS